MNCVRCREFVHENEAMAGHCHVCIEVEYLRLKEQCDIHNRYACTFLEPSTLQHLNSELENAQ